ncbi:MAG TPA: autotransporter outer membrane beta-barrel domain-containing protein, partial [Xanthobacteraceae bacterium]|nr:autotransporter outer membrane beta-barrel domain-containing protein [Xanthobacteraceae bacterium]
SGTTNGNAAVGSNNVTANTYGAAAGMDYRFTPDAIAGFALAGGGTNWNLVQNLGGGRSSAFQAGVYGKMNFGPAYLAAAFGFANHWFTTDRTSFAGDQLSAKFQGQSYGGRFEAGYRLAVLSTAGVTPYAAVQAQSFHTPGYSETDLSGGGMALAYSAMNATDTRSELGARFDALQIVDTMPLVWHGRVAWAHDWVSNPALGAAFQSLPGASFTVNGAAPPANAALVSAGGKLFITPSWSFDAKFDGAFSGSSQTYAGTGTLRYAW